MPTGGSVIYGVAHQHIGGIVSTVYREDRRVICSSIPTYGEGNETGHIVGRSTCYPDPGSVRLSTGETLVLVSNYWRGSQRHTGVMGLFYILVADGLPEPNSFPHGPVKKHKEMALPLLLWVLALFGVTIAIAVVAY